MSLPHLPGLLSIVYITVRSSRKDDAKKLAREICESQLACGVYIIPKIKSVWKYPYNDKVQEESHILLMMKVLTSKMEEVRRFVGERLQTEMNRMISTKIDDGDWSLSMASEILLGTYQIPKYRYW